MHSALNYNHDAQLVSFLEPSATLELDKTHFAAVWVGLRWSINADRTQFAADVTPANRS